MKKKKRLDPSKEDTNVRYKIRSQTLAWLTETAVGSVGLKSYDELKQRTRARQQSDFREWWSLSKQIGWLQLLSMIFWGAGFLYVQQPFVGGIVFFMMIVLAGLFLVSGGVLSVPWISIDAFGEWSMNPLSVMMLIGFTMTQLWWLSVVLPGFFINGRIFNLRSIQILAFFTVLISWIIRLRAHKMLSTGALLGWQIEEEYLMLSVVYAGAWLVIFATLVFGALKFFQMVFRGDRKESDPVFDAFLGFWAGVFFSMAVFLFLVGPGSDRARDYIHEKRIQLEFWKFEKLPHQLEAVERLWNP